MPFDTTDVAARVGQGLQPPRPVNPIANIGMMAETVNALNANKMFQARQIAGQYLEQSIGPNGQPDPAKLNQFLSADPRTAAFAPEILQNAFGLQQAGIANQTSQQSLQAKQFSTLQSALAQTTDDSEVPNIVTRLVASGQIQPDFAANALGGNVNGLDFGTIHSLRKQALLSAANAAEAAASIGTVGQINTGGNITSVVTKVSPSGATVEPASGGAADLATTLTPAEKVSRVAGVNPNTGQPFTAPVGAIATATGQPIKVAGITGSHGEIQTGLQPGAAEGRTVVGQASGQQYATDLATANGGAQRIAQLKELEGLLEAPEGVTGPGTQVVNHWRNFLLGNLPLFAGDPNAPNQAQIQSATQDELKKYMTRAAGDAAAQYGQGTNEKLAVAASGNANPDMSNLANRDVTRMNLAMERAQQARLAQFQQSGLPPEQYSTWAANWNRHVDPRAFMLDMLKPAERQKFLKTIKTPAERAALLRGKAAAEQSGLFSESDIPR